VHVDCRRLPVETEDGGRAVEIALLDGGRIIGVTSVTTSLTA
jgi:hypothetical protein